MSRKVTPEPSQTLTDVVLIVTSFSMQCLNTIYDLSRDFDLEEGWDRIVLVSKNPTNDITIVLLEYDEDFSATIMVNGTDTVLTTDDPEELFDLLIKAQDTD